LRGDLLNKLIIEPDPIPVIVDYIDAEYSPLIQLNDLNASFERLETQLSSLELWLHEAWGHDFYKSLITTPDKWALTKAFEDAKSQNSNILISDGFSLRELLVLKKAFGDRLRYKVGLSPVPTITESAARQFFQVNNLTNAFDGERLIMGERWKGRVINSILSPPQIGVSTGNMLLTQFPDAPLTGALAHRTTQVQDVATVMELLINLIKGLATHSPLTITGDHGYIYLGPNPQSYMWKYIKTERNGGKYGEDGLQLDDCTVAVGRNHVNATIGGNTFITHGGVSLTESIVPVVTIKPGNLH
jgi:hypothetical protein